VLTGGAGNGAIIRLATSARFRPLFESRTRFPLKGPFLLSEAKPSVGTGPRADYNESGKSVSENSTSFGRILGSVVILGAAVALDYVTGDDVSPILFYFSAILVISALAGALLGIAHTILAVLAWHFIRTEPASFIAILWNGVSRLVILGIAVALGASGKDSAGEQIEESSHGL